MKKRESFSFAKQILVQYLREKKLICQLPDRDIATGKGVRIRSLSPPNFVKMNVHH